ncbi:MAG: hypothetical protein JWQ76_36 [Ramlibacter sp.]|nr:hypothetical protein [Ramlibacter sp.]
MAELSPRSPFQRSSHVCALVEDADDAAALIPLFARDGRQQRQKLVALAGGAWLDALRRQLDGLEGFDSSASEAAGHLQLVSWTQVYPPSLEGRKLTAALPSVEKLLSSALDDQRYAGVRMLEQMDWPVSAAGGSQDVAEYEHGVDRLVRTYAQPTVCVYDLSRLSGQLLIDILTAHRFTLLRGALVESPFYEER